MQVIVVATQKGGSGKTTTARHLAVEAGRHTLAPVLLVDLDPMGGLRGWWGRREAEEPRLLDLDGRTLEAALAELWDRPGLLVIDTPPAVGPAMRQVIALASLVLVPVRPSPDDLEAVGATVDLVAGTGVPLVFLINGATKRARLTAEAVVALSQHGTICPATLHHSVAFPASAVRGRTVGEEDPGSAPAQDVAAVWAYVAQRIGLPGKPASRPAGKRSRQLSEVL